MVELPVYTQAYSTDKYLYQKDLPAMTENTVCFWLWRNSASDTNFAGIVSIANPGKLTVYRQDAFIILIIFII